MLAVLKNLLQEKLSMSVVLLAYLKPNANLFSLKGMRLMMRRSSSLKDNSGKSEIGL